MINTNFAAPWVSIFFVLLLPVSSHSLQLNEKMMNDCLHEQLLLAPDDMTVGEMREKCDTLLSAAEAKNTDTPPPVNAIAERLEVDNENVLKPFTIMSHRQNYFLFAAHNFKGYRENKYGEAFNGVDLQQTEAQFQLSIKTPLAINFLDTGVDIFTAYTVRSFWQLYNEDISSPFRETNHEPEAWLSFNPDFQVFGFTNIVNLFGIVHQSNGQSGNLSRSWNRVYADFIFHKGNFAFSLRPWMRIQEDDEDDDNPDITNYLGHGMLTMAYKYRDHTFTLMSRNNIESGFSRGAVEVGWSFPLFTYPYLKGYIQYFSGYGESLIDYDSYANRLGAGIVLTDLL